MRNADDDRRHPRAAHRARRDGHGLTPLGAAKALGEDGDGIETLIVALGANNALGSVISLSVHWSGDGIRRPRGEGAVQRVAARSTSQAELDLVAAEVREDRARHVIWTTVPHVTIAPVARGVRGKVERARATSSTTRARGFADQDFDPTRTTPI